MRPQQTSKDWFEHRLAEDRHTPEFELEWLLLDLEEQIWDTMQAGNVSRSELAERLGTSRAFITKLLSGHENLTLKTLVRVANALEMKVELRLRPRGPVRKRAPAAKSSARATAGTRSPRRPAAARGRRTKARA